MRVTDLKTVTVATSDLEGAVAAFRDNFAFPVTRTTEGEGGRRSTFLRIGAAEIEMTSASDAAGLYELVLEVEDLAAARKALAAQGISTDDGVASDGRPLVLVGPSHTHGVRLTLVGR